MVKIDLRQNFIASLFRNKIIYILTFIFLFIMLYNAPLRADDWTWGARIGIERLQNGFQDYNGRYLGNISVMILTRLPKFLRVFSELAIIALLFGCVFVFLGKNHLVFTLFLGLFFSMPSEIFTQTITWTAGFSNFVISALVVFIILLMDLKILEGKQVPNRLTKIIFPLFVFSGQLYLENATLYIIAFSAFSLLLYYILHRKISFILLLQLGAAVAGALLMFSNGAYLSALSHDGNSYKAVNVESSIFQTIRSILSTFKYVIVNKWFGMNRVVNLVLSLLLSLHCHRKGQRRLAVAGLVFVIVFVYDLLFKGNVVFDSLNFLVGLSFLFLVYISAVTIITFKETQVIIRFVLIVFSILILMLPLTLAEPLSARCFFNTYMLWCLLAAEFFMHLEKPVAKTSVLVQPISLYLIVCLCILCHGQRLSWEIEAARMDAISNFNAAQTTDAKLMLPRVPNSELFCYGVNPEDEYWRNNYKEFYNIDSSVELVFVDYNDFQQGH